MGEVLDIVSLTAQGDGGEVHVGDVLAHGTDRGQDGAVLPGDKDGGGRVDRTEGGHDHDAGPEAPLKPVHVLGEGIPDSMGGRDIRKLVEVLGKRRSFVLLLLHGDLVFQRLETFTIGTFPHNQGKNLERVLLMNCLPIGK